MAELQIVPATVGKNVEAQYVEMRVPLYSYGCEKKIKKALAHLRGTQINTPRLAITVYRHAWIFSAQMMLYRFVSCVVCTCMMK